jgi:hypothetical protein
VLSITSDIVAKVSLKTGDPHMSREQAIFELLNQMPCPHVVQTFLRCPDITFMQSLKNGTLYERMSIVGKPCHITQWMQQLSDAATYLESQGYAQRMAICVRATSSLMMKITPNLATLIIHLKLLVSTVDAKTTSVPGALAGSPVVVVIYSIRTA